MTASQETVNQTSLLQPVQITENELKSASTCPTKYKHQNTLFSHDFIQKELNKFSLSLDRCEKCSDVVSHFINPKALLDHLALDQIKWIPFPNSILQNPAPGMKIPIWDPQNSHLQLNKNCPRGYIELKCFSKPINDTNEFIRIGKQVICICP